MAETWLINFSSGAYLRHHLGLLGRKDQLIADDAIARLHRFAGGIPRALNKSSWQSAPGGLAEH